MEKYLGLMSLILHRVQSNVLWIFMVVLSGVYYDSSVEGGSPTWRTVAVGSMAIVGTLAGLGYRDFISKMRKIEMQIELDRELRRRQHEQNVSAIVALALAGGDKAKIDEVIRRLTMTAG